MSRNRGRYPLGTIYENLISTNLNFSIMNLAKTTAFIFLLFLLGTTVQAQGTETRTPGTFTHIDSGGSWDVYIKKGSKDEVKLVSTNISLDKVITIVDDGKLKIKLEKGNFERVGLTVYVTVRNLDGIGTSGSGDMTVESDFGADEFVIGLSGSGNIEMENILAEEIKVGMSGSGNVTIKGGSAEEISIGQSGSGDLDAMELIGESVKVAKSGSGETSIGVTKNLTVGSSGSGNVYYNGNPQDKSISSSGSSKVIKK